MLDRTCKKVARLKPLPIDLTGEGSRQVVATVATDGGENRLNLDPIRIQVIRVADSLGTIYFEEFIPQSLQPDEVIRFFFAGEERLQRLLSYLSLTWEELIPHTDYQRGNLVAMLRELLEWAATLKLAAERKNLLLLRDGLLRSVLLNDRVFAALRRQLTSLTEKNNHLLVGVAKRSAVINYLAVGLGVTATFSGSSPAYLSIAEDLEREAAPAQYRWIGQRSMGQLHLAKLDHGDGVPLMPVDIAAWQAAEAPEVMALLARSSRASFPLRGYPQELLLAHQHARLGGLETEMLEGLLMQQVIERNPTVAERVRQLRLLGRRLVEEAEDGSDTQE